MKVLAITTKAGMTGGANKSFFSVVRMLNKAPDIEVEVVVPEYGMLCELLNIENIKYTIEKYYLAGVVLKEEIRDIGRIIKTNLIAGQNYISAIRFVKYHITNKPDVVYVNMTNCLFGVYVAELLKVPCVWHFRGFLTDKHRFVFNQVKLFNSKRNRIIAISTAMAESLPQCLKIEKEQIVIIPNGLEKSNEHFIPREYEKLDIAISGRIIPTKCQIDAIKAIKVLVERGQDKVTLHIAGDAPQKEKDTYLRMLKSFVKNNGLQENVIFEGQISDMTAFRRKINIELICSLSEPFGRVTVEAMQSGLVVIGANTGGTLDIVKDGYNGLLYQQGDINDLVNRIDYVWKNPDKAKMLAWNAYVFSKDNFTMEENVCRIHTEMSKMVNEYGNK